MSKTFRSALERSINRIHLQQLKIKSMYNPKITYHFSMDDIERLNEEIKGIAENFHEEETGWFSENEGRQFTDEKGNVFEFDVLGRFFRRDEPEYDLHYIRLKKDGIAFEFDYRIFQDHI